ncbi:hypothetical protein NVV93_01890 [Pseudomonas sp. LS44]|uniref:hypothetical protein n=1 Tax=Pseudomonas sp. LS44 TaxID=1357074 RepID=UPI00215A1976|nr:hypothetical protein [Pseudomonas sp. LS44]UVE18178.1 hypothetical protein NVV93_01890 [Pseudomonas sp. LS44]
MGRAILQFTACLAIGLVLGVIALVLLLFTGEMGLVKGFVLSGTPLAYLALSVLPDAFWLWLTGIHDAAASSTLRSFLELCAALGQLALLLALGLYWTLCREPDDGHAE